MVDRDLLTVEHAVTEAIRAVGAKRIAAACRVSPTAVYAWGDVNKRANVSTVHAVVIDRLYREFTGEPGPFCRLYARLDRLMFMREKPLERLALTMCARAGQVATLVCLYTDPTSDQGDRISNAEAHDLVKAGEAAEGALTAFLTASMARL